MLICGIDEAGRGPIAGPLTSAAVILPEDFPTGMLDDSKKLSPKVREAAAHLIRERAMAWSAGWVWPEEIDRLNIHRATLLAMMRAFRALALRPELVLVDGRFTPPLPVPCRAVIRGDSKFPQIMAASIIAKTERDRWMERYARIEPLYCFEKHKGYPTKAHREIVRRLGISPIHRKSFRIDLS